MNQPSDVRILQSEKVFSVPLVAAFALNGWNEIVKQRTDGLTGSCLEWSNDVIWAESEGRIVGVMVYAWLDWNREVWINIAYVIPERRGQGVYRSMFARLEEVAKEKKAASIATGIHDDNTRMIKLALVTGRQPQPTRTYRKKLNLEEATHE